MIKILIADDQDLIRESLKIVLDLNKDMEVIGTAENGRTVLELVAKNLPDVILMDVRMPEMDGVLCTKAVKEKYPAVKIIILIFTRSNTARAATCSKAVRCRS